jgi:2,3-bisphosphoglycerate-dependent phosphoglycerate mutase
MTDRLLVLVRHGLSDWNLKNLFTGWHDVDLAPKGIEEAHAAGKTLKAQGFSFGICFTSALIRAHHTLDIVGLNKDDARKKWGEEQVHVWRRSYATAPPGGESLRDTGARVWPYYLNRMQPHVLRGEQVLVSAHGNSLRALIMALDGLTPDEVVKLELATGVPVVYRLNEDSTVKEKQILAA